MLSKSKIIPPCHHGKNRRKTTNIVVMFRFNFKVVICGLLMGWTILMLINFSGRLNDFVKDAYFKSTQARFTRERGTIQIFYNIFIESSEDEKRVRSLMDEQLTFMNTIHHSKIQYTSIGHQPENVLYGFIREHSYEGSEGLTLHAIWNYCKANPYHDHKVVYLHSKGSYHDNPENAKLRQFLTKGALSEECSNLPDKCNVCSSRMSPIPHPDTPGNMWLARCDYIAKLIDPTTDFADKNNPYPAIFSNPDAVKKPWCKGYGRYFFEHWVHSHPEVKPCDLYKGNDYFYDYKKVPDAETFDIDLQMATERFPGGLFKGLYNGVCGEDFDGISITKDRIWEYEVLYHKRPDKSWWGWDFYNVTYDEVACFMKPAVIENTV